jgi:sodium transport system permease protein
MKPRPATIGTIFLTEMRMTLRDRRALVTSILLPLLITPLLLTGSLVMNKKRERKLETTEYRYALTGPKAADVRSIIAKIHKPGASAGKSTEQPGAVGTPRDRTPVPAGDTNRFRCRETVQKDPLNALAIGDVHFVVECDVTNMSSPDGPKHPGGGRMRDGEKPDGVNRAMDIRLVYRADRDDSVAGMSKMRDALRDTRQDIRETLLKSRGFPVPLSGLAPVKETDLASEGQKAGHALGGMITLLLLLFIFSGGAVVATDSLAGEKERGTLETLLTTSASRIEIVLAKHLAVLAVALVITLIQSLNFLLYIGLKFIPVSVNFAAAMPPSVALLLFLLYLPLAALASSALLLTSGLARSCKEAQLYFFPLLLAGLMPALVPCLPGLSLHSVIVLVPVANIAVAARDILVGSFDWPMIALSWLVTAAAAAGVTRLSVKFLSAERLIAPVDNDDDEYKGGAALFPRRVLRWFAALWALLLIVNNQYQNVDIRWQILLNVVGLFFGGSVLMMRLYHLDPRQALSLRLPRPGVWIAVILGAPAGLVVAVGLMKVVELFVPMPAKMIEGFTQDLMPGSIPVWQLVLFLCVIPGVFEEIAFRGILLHGLRRRMHPVVLALVVGLVFGFFHFMLFRIIPTAFIGVLLAAITLLTGSIFPAMLWHTLNNLTSVLASEYGFSLAHLDPGSIGLCALILAASFWIIWNNRTPCPPSKESPDRIGVGAGG